MFTPLRIAFDRIVRKGDLRVTDSSGELHRFGDGTGRRVAVRFTDIATERAVAFDSGLGVGEGYMNGTLVIEEGRIYEFLALVFENMETLQLPRWMRGLEALRYVTRRAQQYNPAPRSRRNVAHHYDITPAIYDLFLDPERQYSCAFFEKPGDSRIQPNERLVRGQQIFEALSRGEPARTLIKETAGKLPSGAADTPAGGG